MKTLIPVLLVILLLGCNRQTEWTQWRGPNTNGTLTEAGWASEKLDSANILWTKNVGFGHSAVAVRKDKCFISGWNEVAGESDTIRNTSVYCIDANTGDDIWTYTYSSEKRSFPGPRSTTVIDGRRLYTLSWDGRLFCLNANNGEEMWQVDLAADSLTILDRWGYNPSPVIYENLLLLNLNRSGIALNKKTGEVIWNSEAGLSHYASVQIIDWNGAKAGVFMADSMLNIVEPLTGEVLYSYVKSSQKGMENDVIPTVSGNLFTSNEMLEFNGNGFTQMWLNDTISSAFRTGVIINDYAYQFSNHKNKFLLYCVDLETGEPKWGEDLGKWGGLTAVNDQLFILTGLGKVIIASAKPDKFEKINELQLLSSDDKAENWCWAAPTFLNGKLYVRNSKGEMACVNLSI